MSDNHNFDPILTLSLLHPCMVGQELARRKPHSNLLIEISIRMNDMIHLILIESLTLGPLFINQNNHSMNW